MALAGLAALVAILYGRILRLWWTGDDLFHLRFVETYPPLALGFSPIAWSQFPSRMFTPVQLWSYWADRALFGRIPAGFYVHQLASLSLASAALGSTLRLWLPRLAAWSAAALFLLGVPTSAWVVQLMFRHYIEGLLCAAIAVWCFVRAMRRESASASTILSALFYLLAMLAKEIYIPLIGLLLVLPEGSWRRRARRLAPHFVLLLLYLAWRLAMLGTLLGGYGWAARSGQMPQLLLSVPWRLGAAMAGAAGWGMVPALLLLLAGTAALLVRKPASLLLLVAAGILIAGPTLPVARSINERFGVLVWVLLTGAFVFGCAEFGAASRAASRRSAVLLAGALAAAALANRLDWSTRFGGAQRESAEGRFFLSMEPGDLLRNPKVSASGLKECRWLREKRLGRASGAGWFADDLYLCGGRPAGRVWEYDEAAGRVRDVTQQAIAAAQRYCAHLREAPLEARFESSRRSLFWDLGPYKRGQYALIFERGIEAVAVDREGGYQMSPGVLSLMLRYQAPEGWTTYSPQLTMDFRAASRYRWGREASVP